MPALEAMACGTPVVSSDLPAMHEMLGEAAIFLDSQDAESWASTLLQLHADADLRRTLRERGLAQVRRFDWRRTAQETLTVYHKVLCQ
ncbi:MAG: glycosyltransferase [Chloroflexi bacterium]|nr:glycosyltransferase [Chloroflexota bacterium]